MQWKLPIEIGTGGQTKFNRAKQDYPKAHWLDAVCVGESGANVYVPDTMQPLLIAAKGHGRRQRCRPNRFGFPQAHAPDAKTFQGFQTGDIVKAVVPKGKAVGTHTGRIAIRYRPSFRLNKFDIHPKYMSIVQQADGYQYS